MKNKKRTINIPVRVKSAPKKPRCKEYDAAKRVLDYFYGKLDNEIDDIYQHDLVFGVGDVRADITIYPETFEIMEEALLKVMDFLKEEYAEDCDFSAPEE